jgi:CubicO group peptidase (beta-lactamase class C family)
MIEERVTGQSWNDYMRNSIFRRAALHAWFWGDPTVPKDRVAYGYVGTRKTGDPAHWPLTWAAVGASGILMSAPELFKFARAIDNGVLISNATDSAMQTPALRKWSEGWETSATPYGKLVMKGGASDFGFTGQLRRYVDRGVTIVLLLNSRRDEKDYPHIEVGPGLSDVVFGALSRPAPSLQNL